jgi:hypothetical protein
MAKTKIVIALVAVAAVVLVAVGVASAQIATQTPNTTIGAAPNGFWGYMGRCFQFWANPPIDQTTGHPIIQQVIPPQVSSTNAPFTADPNGYGFRGSCMGRFW